MQLIVGIGIIVSVGLLTGLTSAGGGAGFIVWVVIMLILWGAIPTIATKYYNSDEYKKKDQESTQRIAKEYYEKHPNSAHCPQCLSSNLNLLNIRFDDIALTGLCIYQCNKCGAFHTELKDRNPETNRNTVFTIISEKEANELRKRVPVVALIDCPACGHKVSNQAPTCPNCGQPIKPPEVPRPAATSTSKFCCPKCHSTDYRKIDSLERAASAQLWGVGSGKIGKQYKCNKCGHMW